MRAPGSERGRVTMLMGVAAGSFNVQPGTSRAPASGSHRDHLHPRTRARYLQHPAPGLSFPTPTAVPHPLPPPTPKALGSCPSKDGYLRNGGLLHHLKEPSVQLYQHTPVLRPSHTPTVCSGVVCLHPPTHPPTHPPAPHPPPGC